MHAPEASELERLSEGRERRVGRAVARSKSLYVGSIFRSAAECAGWTSETFFKRKVSGAHAAMYPKGGGGDKDDCPS